MQNLAVTLQLQGKLAEAEPLYAESMQMLSKVLGERIRRRSTLLANYGRFLHRKRRSGARRAGAERCARAGHARRAARRHAFVGHDLVNLGMLRLDSGQLRRAERDLRDALDIYARRAAGRSSLCRFRAVGPRPLPARAATASRKPRRPCAARSRSRRSRWPQTARSSRRASSAWAACWRRENAGMKRHRCCVTAIRSWSRRARTPSVHGCDRCDSLQANAAKQLAMV